jgi:hypothetical protein
MSNLVKQTEPRVLWTIGNTQIVDSEPDQGVIPVLKLGALFIGAITVAPVSPVIAIALAGYGAVKIFDLATAIGKDGADIASNIYDDVNNDAVPDNWVPMPQLPEHQPVKITTQLGEQSAIEVASQPIQTATRPTQTKNALSALLASPYTSRAIFGAQRTGKSYLAAVASFELAKTGVNVFHINLMSYGDEDSHYWQHAKRSVRCDLPALSVDEGKPYIKQAISVVAEFVQTPNSVLIIDEWAYVASISNPHKASLVGFLNDVASQIASLSSAGIKRQRGLWTIAPEFVAGSLVDQGKAIKKLQLVYATIHPLRSVDWNGHQIGFSGELAQQVSNNFPIDFPEAQHLPDYDRIVYINREWMPVGELPSLLKVNPKPEIVQHQPDEEHITFPISEIAAARGIIRPTITPDETDRFSRFAASLTHESQTNLKAFVLWLSARKNQEITFNQIKDSFARNAGVPRSKEAIDPFIQIAIVQKLIDVLPNNNWRVRGS